MKVIFSAETSEMRERLQSDNNGRLAESLSVGGTGSFGSVCSSFSKL
jgi:hypothetical protein